MKTILLSALALGMFAAPALAENATNDSFGGRAPFFTTQLMPVVSGGVDFTATAAIPADLTGKIENGDRAEEVYNRYNR